MVGAVFSSLALFAALTFDDVLKVPESYRFREDARLVKVHRYPDFDIEEYRQANGPGTFQRVLMTVPKSHKLKIKPVRSAVVVPFYFPEAMVGFEPETAEALPKYAGVTMMADLTRRGYICISAEAYHLTAVKSERDRSDFARWPEAAAFLNAKWPGWTGMGKLVHDTRLLVDMLVRDKRVDPEAIGIAGHSLGGKMAMYAGAVDPRIKAILASDPGVCWDRTNWNDSWYFGDRLPAMVAAGLDHAKLLRGAGGKPFCLLCGDADGSWSAELLKGVPGAEVIDPKLNRHRPAKYVLDKGYDFLDRHLCVKIEPECFPPAKQPAAEIVWMREICRQTNRMIGWPTVCRRRNGELLAVFSGDRDCHVCPFGKVQLVRSSDGGETWSEPETVVDDSLDDRDAGLIELDNGDLLLFYFNSICFSIDTWNRSHGMYLRHYGKLSPEDVRRELGYFSRRSTDGGRTWEAPVRMSVTAPHGGIQLRDGRVMAIGRRWNPDGNAPLEDLGRGSSIPEIAVEISADRGRSWSLISKVPASSGLEFKNMHEPHLVELSDGTILMLCNHNSGDLHLLQSVSKDGGRTWSPLGKTSLDGYPSHLTRLADGRILCVYACRKPGREGEYAAVSGNGGKTWDAVPEILLSRGTCSDIGYPSSVQLPDGSILTVYYQSARHFELPVLMATKWRLTK